MKTINCAIALCIFFAAGAQAATLTELQQQALENRNLVKKYEAALEIGKRDESLAKSRLYPSLDLSYTANALDENSASEDSENSVAVGAITWNLFAGFQDRYNIRSAQLTKSADAFKLAGIKQDIQLNVALRYLTAYTSQASLQVAKDSCATLRKIHTDAENRYNVGLIKKNELLRFKVDLDNAVITEKKAQADLDKSIRLLKREIDGEVDPGTLTFGEFDQLPSLDEKSAIETKMLENRSELRALQELAQAANVQIKAAYGAMLPRLDITGSYRKYTDEYDLSGNTADEELRTQLTLSMNLFDGFGKYHRVGKAKRQEDSLRYDLAELESDLKAQLQNLFLDYAVSAENIGVAKSSIELAEENLRITRLSYQEGLEKESDLLDAITNLSRAQYNFVSAKSELFANYFKITRAVEGF